jgi:uncharacterized protein (TIGR02594 family)
MLTNQSLQLRAGCNARNWQSDTVDSAPWMKVAIQEIGQHEVKFKKDNPRILLYHSTVGRAKHDETPWCSAFANWCMKQVGLDGSGKANARSWLAWGQPIATPVFGTVTVFSRPPKDWQGHVGFYMGSNRGKIVVLGGNQKDSVCVAEYPHVRLLGYRWPKHVPLPS